MNILTRISIYLILLSVRNYDLYTEGANSFRAEWFSAGYYCLKFKSKVTYLPTFPILLEFNWLIGCKATQPMIHTCCYVSNNGLTPRRGGRARNGIEKVLPFSPKFHELRKIKINSFLFSKFLVRITICTI